MNPVAPVIRIDLGRSSSPFLRPCPRGLHVVGRRVGEHLLECGERGSADGAALPRVEPGVASLEPSRSC
jgi:hypothetical protein